METPTAEQIAETIERRVPEGLQPLTTNPMGMRNLALAEECVSIEKDAEANPIPILQGIADDYGEEGISRQAAARVAITMIRELQALREAVRSAEEEIEREWVSIYGNEGSASLSCLEILRERTGPYMAIEAAKLPPGVPDDRD